MALRRYLATGIVIALTLSSCSPDDSTADTTDPPTTTATSAPSTTRVTTTTRSPTPPPLLDPDGRYAVVAFTNHLPAFGRTAEGAMDRPWARLHTTRDYIMMTRLIAEADAQIVLAFSPILLSQIGEIASGNWDQAALITAKPAGELTVEDKAYIDRVFFQASPAQIDRFPRYRELADRKIQGRSLSTSDYRDIQVLFNLAWSSSLLLEEEPLLSLAARGRGYRDSDKQQILDVHQAAAAEFLQSLRDLWSAGKVEVATTPLANPTLPLLVRNRMDEDAAAQITQGADVAAAVLERRPTGLVPRDGLLDQANAAAVHSAGYQWLLLNEADVTAQPRQLSDEDGVVLALFSDATGGRISDTYFGMDPNAAALDVITRLGEAMTAPGTVATLSADGTEPWGRYEDGGVAFLRSLLRQLAASPEFETALPTDLSTSLDFEPGPYPTLPDSYLSESDELAAWAYLGETRRQLLREREVGAVAAADLADAYENILYSQDGDWYWWYGTRRASGDDAYYDELFRSKLAAAWRAFGDTPPGWAQVPLHESAPVQANRQNTPRAATIEVNNSITDAEWSRAGYFEERSSGLIRRVFYTTDESTLFIRIDFTSEVLGDSAPGFDLYLAGPGAQGSALTPQENGIGFEASRVASWRATNPVRISAPRPYPGSLDSEVLDIGFDGNSIEFSFALDAIEAGMRPGDSIAFRIIDVTGGPEGTAFPAAARGAFELPNLEEGVQLAQIADRLRDDYGPGTYSYVTDSQTRAGTYDLAGLAVRQIGTPTAADPDSQSEVQFEITFREPLTNPWSAPAGFSHQTVDLYLEAYPGTDTGAHRLLPGRIAAADVGWDYAFSVDGWEGRHYSADAAGTVTELNTALEYVVLADRRTILVTVPRSELPPGDVTIWRYGVAVLANQAIPSLGIHGLRPLGATPNRFRLGGGTGALNDPMLIDLLHPDAGVQEEALAYSNAISSGDPETVGVEWLARLRFLAG